MRSPLEDGHWHELKEVASTQDLAAQAVREGKGGIFFARDQSVGRGRFGREWISGPGESLTFSMTFGAYADHPRAYLIGMSVAIAAAAVVRCELAWPNDLVAEGKKLGGILTELVKDNQGRTIAIVGVGINLNQQQFPQAIRDRATSLALYGGGAYAPLEIGHQIIDCLATLPEPNTWSDLRPVWELFDSTPGKEYKLPSGETAIAVAIGPEGELMCSVNGETMTVMAAEAIFGG